MTRRIGVALVAALAVATAATEGDSQAQSLNLQLGQTQVQVPSVTVSPQQIAVPQATVEAPAVTVTTPSVTVTPPPAPPPPVQVTPPTVRVNPPPVPVKPPAVPVKPPSVPVNPPPVNPAPVKPPTGGGTPSLPVKPPSLPGNPTGGSGPSTPSVPGVDGVRDRVAGGGGGGGVTLRSLLGRGDAPAGAVGGGGSTGGGSTGAGGSGAAAGIPVAALTQAAPGIARVPTPAELAKLPPAQRRKIVRQIWDTPLRKQRLRQLRTAIAEYQGCLDMLSSRGQRALMLRAGVGRAPATRRVVARRLGTSLRGAVRIERTALRRLVGAGERGLCGGGSGGGTAATLGDGQGATGDAAGTSGSTDGDRDGVTPVSDVLADVHEGGPGVDLGDGEEGSTETLLFFLLALLGPLAAIAIASRRRAANGAAAADADERPVLFLDVDGVIALSPFSSALPPGRVQQLALGSTYVSDHTGGLLRDLATRFELVWATGWEHHANSSLLSPLGLEEELPTLTFGKKARHGSSRWKIKSVDAYAGNRPAAWLDDNFVARHERWAAHRSAPTLLVRVDSRVGLAPEHVDRLMKWADRVAPPARVSSNGSSNGGQRSRARAR